MAGVRTPHASCGRRIGRSPCRLLARPGREWCRMMASTPLILAAVLLAVAALPGIDSISCLSGSGTACYSLVSWSWSWPEDPPPEPVAEQAPPLVYASISTLALEQEYSCSADMASDSAAPEVVRAFYDPASSILHVALDETIGAGHVNASGFALRNASGAALHLGSFDMAGSNLLAARVSGDVASASGMTLDVAAGSVEDTAGNPLAPASVAVAVEAPSVESASYDRDNRMLIVSFDRQISVGNASAFAINGSTLSESEHAHTMPTHRAYFILNEEHHGAVARAPVLDVGPGAVLGQGGIPLEGAWRVPIYGAESPAGGLNPVYNAMTDTLYLELPGGFSMDYSKVTLRNSTASLHISEMDVILNGEAVSSGGSALGGSNMSLDVQDGAITMSTYSAPAMSGIPVAVFGGMGTDVSYSVQVGASTDMVYVGPGLVAAIMSYGVGVYELAGDSAKMVSFVGAGAARLLDGVAIPDAPYVAVLAGDSVRFLDVGDPASASWAGSAGVSASRGALTYVEVHGVPYVAAVTQNALSLVRASDISEPRVVSSALLEGAAPAGFGAASFGSVVYTSLRPGTINSVDVADTALYEYECSSHSGDVGAVDAVAAGGNRYVVSAGDGPSVYVRTTDLGTEYSIDVPSRPTDIASVTIYGTTYILVAAGDLYVYDITDEPELVATIGPYVSLDVGTFGGSTHAVLLDPDGMMSVVDLAQTHTGAGQN